MSSTARPVSPGRFRTAIQDLPVGTLHNKAAELRNSIAHLQRSNTQLEVFSDDPDLKVVIAENVHVMQRMEHRIMMLREEVERRGLRWPADDAHHRDVILKPGEDLVTNGVSSIAAAGGERRSNQNQAMSNRPSTAPVVSGSLGDEELRGLLAEMIEQSDALVDDEEGVHL